MKDSSYCTPYQREISNEERLLLIFLLEREAPDRLGQIESLKVIAICGCGGCPTVLFGSSFDVDPATQGNYILADYSGKTAAGGLVGVMLWANDQALTELEGYSIDGVEPVVWPAPLSLRALA
ncbi:MULTISPECIES: hypothetical protein [unclassified Pseudoxanthomonas]|uniref:hypothetical protein n=1 Tax=unclassified Pseudoxanthomonas TaxID=2645906 RepID=UPI0011145192|nr:MULTISPECIES: hypothetical protein [unclassified Pseudoxanthomonas]